MLPVLQIGWRFLCVKTLLNDDGITLYREGEEYICENKNCITDELGESQYEWWNSDYNFYSVFAEHFEKVED